ncbi:hypothetical protein SAMN02745866_03750 [Alteromonadaceae bacterium Bs31]|nr:hypothetical protein SAMN02745866_03750 [Alteromonadaceae bacterium Bs31]
MDFDAWNVDLEKLSAFHITGFRISIEGSPLQPLGVLPSHFPDHLSAVEQARLLRCGMKAIRDAALSEKHQSTA